MVKLCGKLMAADYSWLQYMTTNNQYFKHDDYFLRVQEVKCQHGKGKRVKAQTVGAYPSFVSMKHPLEYYIFATPPWTGC